MMLHAFSYRTYAEPPGSPRRTPPWPAGARIAAARWSSRTPGISAGRRSRPLPALAQYVGRAGAAVRAGRPRVDLTLLNATSRVAGIGVAPPAPGSREDRLRETLQGAGFTWDAMDPVSLPQAGGVAGRRLLPKGPAYKALVVNDLQAILAASARRLAALAGDGLPVVVYGRVPAQGAGFKDPSSEDSAVRAAVRRLRALPDARFATTPAGLVGALRDLGIEPDLAQGPGARVVPVHRRTATGDVWFLYNDSARPVTSTVRFATGGAPTQIDLWTGQATRPAHYTERGRARERPRDAPPSRHRGDDVRPASCGRGERHVDHGGRRSRAGRAARAARLRGGPADRRADATAARSARRCPCSLVRAP
jgi:hypothetical protein